MKIEEKPPRRNPTDAPEFRIEKLAIAEANRLNRESPQEGSRWEPYGHGRGWSIRLVVTER